MKAVLTLLLFYFSCLQLSAQTVETLVSSTALRDGLHVDADGNIYIASGGFAGFEVGKYDIETGEFDPNFARGFFGPVDVDMYRDSMLVVTNYDNNTVSAYNINSHTSRVIASGLDGPSGIAIDSRDNIYVASWGNAPAYAGRQIHKISAIGRVSRFILSPLLYRPQAMTFDAKGILIVHSNEKLYKVIDGKLEEWIDLGTTTGHMVLRSKDSCIYASAGNRILRITPEGAFSIYAGSTEGYQDGPLSTAKFKGLLGIEFSPDENILYVCDSGYGNNIGRLRKITMEQTTSTNTPNLESVHVFPNPIDDVLNIHQGSAQSVGVEVFDLSGKLIISKIENDASIQINTNALDDGAYLLKLNYPDRTITQKLIKQKL